MDDKRFTIQICGFGGQGVILASIIFGMAAVTEKGYFAVQTQSFGSEARGGECQAELVLSKEPIYSPTSNNVNMLLGMSNLAFNRYLTRVGTKGTLIIDPDLVNNPNRADVTIFEIPANQIAKELGFALSANMVFLGALQRVSEIISEQDLFSAIRQNVNERFLDINLLAARKGIELANNLINQE